MKFIDSDTNENAFVIKNGDKQGLLSILLSGKSVFSSSSRKKYELCNRKRIVVEDNNLTVYVIEVD